MLYSSSTPNPELKSYSVTYVEDADTILVKRGLQSLTVRFSLIDAPEVSHSHFETYSQHPSVKNQLHWGELAKTRASQLIQESNNQVQLQITGKDNYGRSLSEVFINGQSLQEQLLREGLVKANYSFITDPSLKARVKAAESVASSSRLGLWSDPNFLTPSIYRDLLRKNSFDPNPFKSLSQPYKDLVSLYLPTSLPEAFSTKYPSSKPQLYTDSFYTFTGKMPSGFQKYLAKTADSQLGTVSFGSFINRIFPDLYTPGSGLVTTFAKGVGRALDTITGFYSLDYYEKLREGKLRGGFKKYHQNQYTTYQQRGIFENLLGGITTSVAATSSSLAFYFGVSHTLSIARSHFEDLGVDYVANLLSKQNSSFGDLALKSFFFSGELLNVFSEIEQAGLSGPKGQQIQDYLDYVVDKASDSIPFSNRQPRLPQSSTNFLDLDTFYIKNLGYTDSLVDTLYEEFNSLYKANQNITFDDAAKQIELNVLGLNRAEGEIDLSRGLASGYNRPSGGLFSSIGSLRKIDSSNFINIVRPVISQIAVGNPQELIQLNIELDKLQSQVGRSPFLKYGEVSSGVTTFLDDITPQQYGYSRLETIATLLDKVSEYIPANPLLYYKPYRDMVGITSLKVNKGNNQTENYHLKELLSPGFSGLTKFSRRIMRLFGDFGDTESIVQQMSNNFKLFEFEQQLNRAEQKLFKDTTRILKKQASTSVAQLGDLINNQQASQNLIADLTDALYNPSTGTVTITIQELLSKPKSLKVIENYKKNLADYNKLLSQTDNVVENLYSPTKTAFRSIRGAIFSVGPLLILDKVLDPQFMRSPSIDLLTQVFTDASLLHDGKTRHAQIEYTGTAPDYIKYPAMGIGFILGGHSLPRFQQRQAAGGDFIEKAITKAVGRADVLGILNSKVASTPFSSLLSGLQVDDFKDVLNTRTRTRFGWLGGFLGGAAALIGTQVMFGMAAGFMNFIRSPFRDAAPNTQQEQIIAAFSLAASLRHRLNNLNEDKPLSKNDLALMEVSFTAATSLLYGRPNRPREIFTFATQIPNPIFQFTAVSKLDPQGNSLTLGAGFQFLPILGIGSIPAAPFEIRLKPLMTRAEKRKSQFLLSESLSTSLDADTNLKSKNSSLTSNLLSILSLPGHLISINKDTSFSQIISFVGASSYLASATNKVENFLRRNASQRLKTELKQVKPLYDIVKFGLGTLETMARYSQVPLLVMPNTLMKATTSYFNVPQQSLAKLGPKARAVAPYLLAYAFAAGITSPEGSFSDIEAGKEPDYAAAEFSRFTFSVLPITAIYGTGLRQAGVFAPASTFSSVQGNSYIARKQRQIAQIALESGAIEAPLIRSAALRLSIASRRIFSISTVLAAAGLGIRAITGSNLGFLDIISDSSPTPVNAEQAAYWRAAGIKTARYQPRNLGEAAGNFVNYLTRSIGGLLGVDRLIYRDDPNAFLSLAGPFGASEGKSGFRLYTQAQATFTDISGSKYSLGEALMSADLEMQLASLINAVNKTDYDKVTNLSLFSDRYQKFRGSIPRKTPAKIVGNLSSSEAQAAAGSSSAFISAMAYRKAYGDYLRNQRPSELLQDLIMDSAKTGRLGSRFGFIKPSFSPLATLGSITGEFKYNRSSALQIISTQLSNFVNQVRGTGSAYGSELITDTPKEQQTSLPVIGYFTDTFKYLLGGFSGKTTVAASGTLLLQQAPLLLLTVGSSLTFAIQIVAALAAYQQGALTQDALRKAEDKHLDFKRRRGIEINYREVDGKYYLSIEPNKKGSVKPKILSLSSQILEDFNLVSAGSDLQDTEQKIISLTKSVQRTFRDYYKELITLVNPQSNTPIIGLDIDNILSGSTSPSEFENQLKTYIKDKLLQRSIVTPTGQGRATLKLHEILSITEDSVLSKLDGVELEVQSIISNTSISDQAKKNLIKVATASRLQNVDASLFENATASYLTDFEITRQFDYRPEIGMPRTRIPGLTGSALATSEIIHRSGYIGLLKQGLQGAGRLTNKLLDIVPFYNIASALTKAASSYDNLERSRAAGAAAYYTSTLPQIALSIAAFKGLMALGFVGGVGLTAAGVGLYFADRYFLNGATTKAIQKGSRWIDRNIGSPFTKNLAGFYNSAAQTPVVSQLLSIVGLPFRLLDPLLESAWQSAENSPAAYFALSLLLPRTVDQVYQEQSAKNPAYNRAGERIELLTSSEVRRYYQQKLKYNRAKSESLSASASTLAPFVLGGTTSVSEEQLQNKYFNSKTGTPRVLSPFLNQSMVSGILQLGVERREAIEAHSGYGSYRRRTLLSFDGLGKTSVISSVYLKASLAFDGTYQGLLAKGLSETASSLSWVARGWTNFTSWTSNITAKVLSRTVAATWGRFSNLLTSIGNSIANADLTKNTVKAIKSIPTALGNTRFGKFLSSAKTGIVERLSDFRVTAGARFVRGSVFALSAYAFTSAASQITLQLLALTLDPNDKDSAEIFYQAATFASSPLLPSIVSTGTMVATLASRRVSPALARFNTTLYKGLLTSFAGAGLYGGTAFVASFLPALFIKDEQIKEYFQTGAAISFGILGAFRYGTVSPFRLASSRLRGSKMRFGSRKPRLIKTSRFSNPVPLNRFTLLQADINRAKGIGIWTGKLLVSLVPKILRTKTSQLFARVTSLFSRGFQSFTTIFSRFNWKPLSSPKVAKALQYGKQIGRRVGNAFRATGVVAKNFVPSLLDIGFGVYAASQVLELDNRSTRQQYRAEFQNLYSVSSNALVGSLLALKMRSPGAALIVTLGLERTVNPLVGQYLGDLGFKDETGIVKSGVVVGSAAAISYSSYLGIQYGFKALKVPIPPSLPFKALAKPAQGVISVVQTGYHLNRLFKESQRKPKDYRLVSQSLGKDSAGIVSAAVNSLGLVGGPIGLYGTAIATTVAEPYLADYFSKSLEKRMRQAGKTSKNSGKQLQQNAFLGALVGAAVGTGVAVLGAVAFAASIPILAVASVIGLAVGAAVGLYLGIESFFWGSKASPFYKGSDSSVQSASTSSSKAVSKAYSRSNRSKSSIIVASSGSIQSDVGMYSFEEEEKSLNYAQQKLKNFRQSKDSTSKFIQSITLEYQTGSFLARDPILSSNIFEQFFKGVGSLISSGINMTLSQAKQLAEVGNKAVNRVLEGATQVGLTVSNAYTQLFGTDIIVRDPLDARNSFNQKLLLSFADTEIHHPSRGRRGIRSGRTYREINGVYEEVNSANPYLIKKDFLLRKNGSLAVNVPSPVAGYVSIDRSWGAVYIYADNKKKDLLGVVGHLSNITLQPGQYVKYGQDLGLQSGVGGYPVHTHMELTIEGYNSYFRDVQDGVYDRNLSNTGNIRAGGKFNFSPGYESLSKLAEILSTNRYFDQSTAQGRGALAVAILIAGTEAFGKGTTRTDYFTYMGGRGGKMKGFAQYNTNVPIFTAEIATQEGYINLLGSMLTANRNLPTGRKSFNSIELVQAIEKGKVSSGAELEKFVQSRISRTDWQGLHDGLQRVPGLADQLYLYLKQPYSSNTTSAAPSATSATRNSLGQQPYTVTQVVSPMFRGVAPTGEKATFYFEDTKEQKTLTKVASRWLWTDGVNDYWIRATGDMKSFMANYNKNKKPVFIKASQYNISPNLNLVTKVSIPVSEGNYIVPAERENIQETERILNKQNFYIKAVLGTGYISSSSKRQGYGFVRTGENPVDVIGNISVDLDKYSAGFYTNNKGETRLLNLGNLSAKQKEEFFKNLKANKNIIAAYLMSSKVEKSDSKASGGPTYKTNFLAFDSSGLFLGVVSTSQSEASGRLKDANKAFNGKATSLVQLDGDFYTKMWFDNPSYRNVSNSRALAYKNAILLISKRDKNSNSTSSVSSSITRDEVVKIIREKYIESLNNDTSVQKLRSKFGNNYYNIPVGVISRFSNTEIMGISAAKIRAKKEVEEIYKDEIKKYKIDIDKITKDIIPTNPGIIPPFLKPNSKDWNPLDDERNPFNRPWNPFYKPKKSYAPKPPSRQALSMSDRNAVISSSSSLPTNQLQSITKEYREGNQILEQEKQKVTQQKQNVNIQLEAPGATSKPNDNKADPLINNTKAQAEVEQRAAVTKTESGLSVRIEKKVDEAYHIEKAANPFPTRVNKELADKEPQQGNSFNSSAFINLFGLADGWMSQQYA